MEMQVTPLVGGLDLASPALQVKPGRMIACENYECTLQGYHRIDGWERLDGQPKPSEATPYSLAFDAGTTEPSVGDKIEGATSAAFGFLLEITVDSGSWAGNDAAGTMILRNVSGTFSDNEDLQVSAVTHAVASGTAETPVGDTDAEQASYLADARDAARAEIAAVPGSGSVLGVVSYMGDTYAFRDNAGGTAAVMHKATTSGWSAQSFGVTLDFTSGSTAPSEGDTISGNTSSATATVERVILQSGSWGSGDAAGYLVLSGQSGTFQSETIDNDTTSDVDVMTIAGDSEAITLPAGGSYGFTVHNFYGASNLKRLYFVSGEGYAHEWDGSVLAPIRTGLSASLDKPTHVGVLSNHLFLGYDGGHIQFSGTGLPLSFLAADGAGTLGLGDDLTDMASATRSTLIVMARNKVAYITGTDSTNFQLNEYSDESGAVAGTLQMLNEPYFLDDRGVRQMSAVEAFGDWSMGTISKAVEPLILGKKAGGVTPAGSMRVREKDQYRLIYSDGAVLSFYFGRGKVEPSRSQLNFTPTCVYSGEDGSGNELLLAGADDGFVYQIDAGTSADGSEIEAFVRLAFDHQGNPNQIKRYHRGRIEIEGGSGPVSLGVLANFSYGDPEQPEMDERTYDFAGGGGFWDEALWNEFYWSTAYQSVVMVDFDAVGSNISVVLASDLTEEDPHTLSALSIYFSPRRVIQ